MVHQLKQRRVPVNLRISGDVQHGKMLIDGRVRKNAYFHKSIEYGAWCFSVYNNMYHPRCYVPLEEGGMMREYDYLTKRVTVWNVAVERQIMVKGPDALDFVNLVITRNAYTKLPVNQARYVILCDQHGGVINDPVLLRVAEDEFWFSISDSDLELWFKGLNYGLQYNVDIAEIDVSPVQIQGPYSKPLLKEICGEQVEGMKYYKLWQTNIEGLPVVISRTGFSAEVGYEIYLHNSMENADKLFEVLERYGKKYGLKMIAPSHVRRLEAGILSFRQDVDIENNPFEVGQGWQVDLSDQNTFIGKDACARIKQDGIKMKLAGIKMGGNPLVWYNYDYYHVLDEKGENFVGYVTSSFYSPKLGVNIALAMMPIDKTEIGTKVTVDLPNTDGVVDGEVSQVPFFDPNKELPKG